MTLQLSPARKITKPPADRTRSAVPRSGWRRISAAGIDEQQARDHPVEPAQAALAALEVPGEHQRHRDLEQLRGLDPPESEVEPAPRALRDVAEQRHRDQQRDADQVQRDGRAHHPGRRNVRSDPQHGERDQQVANVALEAPGKVHRRRVHRQHAETDEQRERRAERRVEDRDVVADPAQDCRAFVHGRVAAGSTVSGSTLTGTSRISASAACVEAGSPRRGADSCASGVTFPSR